MSAKRTKRATSSIARSRARQVAGSNRRTRRRPSSTAGKPDGYALLRAIDDRLLDPLRPADERNPSAVSDDWWIRAVNRTGNYPRRTPYSGKWLLFVPNSKVDTVWATIKRATEEGRLGLSSKVATARPNPHATDPETKVICVYTYDHRDEKDVLRIRGVLRELGFAEAIPYKTDAATLAGRYRVRGDTRVSTYFC